MTTAVSSASLLGQAIRGLLESGLEPDVIVSLTMAVIDSARRAQGVEGVWVP